MMLPGTVHASHIPLSAGHEPGPFFMVYFFPPPCEKSYIHKDEAEETMSDTMLLPEDEAAELLASVRTSSDAEIPSLSEEGAEFHPHLKVIDFLRREMLTDEEKDTCAERFGSATGVIAKLFSVDEKDVELSFIDTIDFMTVMKSMPRVCRCASLGTPQSFSIFVDLDPEAGALAEKAGGLEKFLTSLLVKMNSALFGMPASGPFKLYDSASLLPLPVDPAVVMAVYMVARGKKQYRVAVLLPSWRFAAGSVPAPHVKVPSAQSWLAAVGGKRSFTGGRYIVAVGRAVLSAENAKRVKNHSLLKLSAVDLYPSYLVDMTTGKAVFQGEAVSVDGRLGLRITGMGKGLQYVPDPDASVFLCLSAGTADTDEDTVSILGEGCVVETNTPETGLLELVCSNGINLPCRFSCNGEDGWARIFLS